ncbi:mitotic spindle assembly checkpoint protein MAD2B-like [Pollicipes pollicipes]|uniref:mitotic spindle assembly checkpoint protein MAD2B-like n=1 Tax=Pollicipes pollicipes TaxID=41117 RepID=UPI0018858376|nr:mitotic spindle assembly checkpoint protein MAD2B-like [Pollicipes pollicipes]
MAACDLILEFVETALHSILYLRKLYPEAIFRKRQKYKVPVQMSVHKEVNEYIASTLSSLRPYLQEQLLEELAIVVIDPGGRTFETVTIELAVLGGDAYTVRGDEYLTRLEATLSGLLLGLYATLADCPAPPTDSTFRVHATVARCRSETLEQTEGFLLTVAAAPPPPPEDGCHVLPIRSVRNELFSVQMALRRPPGRVGR